MLTSKHYCVCTSSSIYACVFQSYMLTPSPMSTTCVFETKELGEWEVPWTKTRSYCAVGDKWTQKKSQNGLQSKDY